MGEHLSEKALEEKRLQETIAIAKEQLALAKERWEQKKEEIAASKKEIRENATHGVLSLWSPDDFEAIVELSQYVNPFLEQMASYEEEENKLWILEKLISSPYFARIDFRFDGEEEPEPIYIGRASLKKDARQIYVYDWRSPIASVFYRFMTGDAFYDAPGGRVTGQVTRKRQYEIKDGVLAYFFDADVQIVDAVLRQMLSQNASPKMKAIVETIQKEQDLVIRDMESDLLMVQGTAGSGKTSIALHRAAYLMYQGLQTKLSANDILILSPSSLFEQYISDVLPELGENHVASVLFDDILRSLLPDRRLQGRNEFLEQLFTDRCHQALRKRSMAYKTSDRFMEILDHFLLDVPHKWIPWNDICYQGKRIISKEALREKMQKRADIPLGARLEQLEDFILEQIFGTGKRRGNPREEERIRQEIRPFTRPDVTALYQKLFADRDYFRSLAAGTGHASEENSGDIPDDIWEYTRENLDSGQLYYEDAIAAAYLYLKLYGYRTNRFRTIRQVIIDEAQDYYPLQYALFALLFPAAKFTVLGDMNQTLERQEDLSLYKQMQKKFRRKNARLITLDKSFRCTNEILSFSLAFIPHSRETKSFNRSGDRVNIAAVPTRRELTGKICEEVSLCRDSGFSSIGLLCKTEKNCLGLFEALQSSMEIRLIRDGNPSELQGTFILPIYLAKGLEFDAVILCDADSQTYGEEADKNLFYIASTRALHRLSLFCQGELSPFLPG